MAKGGGKAGVGHLGKEFQASKMEDSNIALLGSDLNRKVKAAAAESEEAWKGCGKEPGVEIWRIESFKVVKWPKEEYGKFFSGDSYIILHSYYDPAKPEQKKLLYNVHFWLGEKTSQDEAGTAAYKTVELDDLLGDLPVQFREVQGSESEEFLALWEKNGGIRIMDGGVDSGFKRVKPTEYKPRLMHVKGKKFVRVKEVALSCDSLNHGDVFILDCGLQIIQWNGEKSSVHEKHKAKDISQNIREERNGKPTYTVLDGEEAHDVFWTTLGGKKKVKSAEEGGSDDKVSEFVKTLHRVSDASGKLDMTEVGAGTFSKADLDPNDVFIVDTEAMIFVWIGKGASKDERGEAFRIANEYLVKAGRPFTTPVVRVLDGQKHGAFEDAFSGAGQKVNKPAAKKH